MKKLVFAGLFLLTAAVAARAQERHMMPAGDALDTETCKALVDRIMPRIEAYTRMKFRRPVPIRVEPKAVWENRLKQGGFGGYAARAGAAFYNLVSNQITVVPWVIGGYLGGTPRKRTREEWLGILEPTVTHELTHAIHRQNFFVLLGGARQASLKKEGLTEEELDVSTVEFLVAEGIAELVSERTATPEGRAWVARNPSSELSEPRRYMTHYQPNGKDPYRVVLSGSGYQDGIDLLHHLTLKAGPRGVRAVLYRPPPRELFFQPKLLATVDLDDPPNPDSIFGFLSPKLLAGGEIQLAVNPGANRFFLRAIGQISERAPGCLIGYVTEIDDSDTNSLSRYAFFVADPDEPGTWTTAQAASLKALNPSTAKEKTAAVPMQDGVKAKVITVSLADGSRYVRAETGGLVVLAFENRPTSNLEERTVLALSALYIRRPTAKIYDKALVEARKNIK
jgi:hypothetical protein